MALSGTSDHPVAGAVLDVSSALLRLNGNLDLYRKLLLVFRERYRKSLPAAETFAVPEEREKVRIFIHSMKGAAGNIGASRVQAEAEALEVHLIERSSPDLAFVRTRLSRLSNELEYAFAEADEFLSPIDAPKLEPKPGDD